VTHLAHHFIQSVDELKRGAGWCVSAVGEDVDDHVFHTTFPGRGHNLKHLITVGMDPFIL